MVIVRAVVRDLFDASGAARIYSTLMLIMGVAPILAPAMGGQILIWLDWRWIFGLLALLGGGCLLAVALRLPETLPAAVMAQNRAQPIRAVVADYGEVLRTRQFLAYALTGGSSLAALFAYISGSPFVLIELLGVSPGLYGILFGANAAAFILGSQVNARLLRRAAPASILPWTVGAFCAATLLLLVVVATPLFGVLSFMIAMGLVLFAVGCSMANTTALALHPFWRQAGSASAICRAAASISGAAAIASARCRGVSDRIRTSRFSASASRCPRRRAARIASVARVTSCEVKALVEATPISGPARIGSTTPDSRAMEEVTTFTTETTCPTCGAAWRSAARARDA